MKFPKVTIEKSGSEVVEALSAGHADVAREIIKQRIEGGKVFESGKDPIMFRDPTLVGRWFNSLINPDHIWNAKRRKGWQPVTGDMLADSDQLGGLTVNSAGHIVRGERGQELLMFMDRESFEAIKLAKARESDRRMGSSDKAKDDIAEAAEAELGPGQGDAIRRGLVGEVTDGIERVTQEG